MLIVRHCYRDIFCSLPAGEDISLAEMECHYSVNYQEKEEDLLCAITEGNLEKVRQLLTSGMGINTVLHSKTSQQSATVHCRI